MVHMKSHFQTDHSQKNKIFRFKYIMNKLFNKILIKKYQFRKLPDLTNSSSTYKLPLPHSDKL